MRFENIVAGIGVLLFIFGGCGMDSPDMTVPVVMALGGLALVVIGRLLHEEIC